MSKFTINKVINTFDYKGNFIERKVIKQKEFYYKLGCFIVSGIYIGIKKVDIRFTINWGWQ